MILLCDYVVVFMS